MGNWNSGRRPTPTALKILRGNPGKRRIRDDEPTPPTVPPSFDTPPRALDGDKIARAEWRRLAPIMRECGLISEVERSSLSALCLEWSTYLDARHHLRDEGRVLKNADGETFISSYVAIANTALGHCHRLWTELGLTPSGRAKVARLPPGRREPAPPLAERGKWAGTGL